MRVTVLNFINGNISSWASALTYNTLLASVPVLAIAFAVARGFGFDALIESKLYNVLDFSPEAADQIITFVNSYLQHTKNGMFLGVGIVVLMYTVVNLTSNIETAFNTIWRVRNSRSIYRQVSDYISISLLMPLIFIITSGFGVFLMTFAAMFDDMVIVTDTVQWVILFSPYIITSVCFILLYKLMPNTHVKWRYCVVPGMLAGILFQAMAYFYVHYQIKLSSYNAIYGSFAALPLFLVFIQISWYICLFGGQVTHTWQTMENGTGGQDAADDGNDVQSQLSGINERMAELSAQIEELNRRLG